MGELNRFNWIAPRYDKLAGLVFGNVLDVAQSHFIPRIGSHDKILIVGGGSGKFLKSLLLLRPLVSITYVEASSQMIALARKQTDNHARVTFIHGTHENIPHEIFDVVFTNFFLDLFPQNQIDRVVESIAKGLSAGGKWIVTDFVNTKRARHRLLLSVMYIFFRVTGSIATMRLPSWRDSFEKRFLKITDERSYQNGFITTTLFVKDGSY